MYNTMLFLLNKQCYNYAELTNKLNSIQKNKSNLISTQYKILVNIYDDKIYDKIIDIFDKINDCYILNIYGNNTVYITIYNDIIIHIENDTDYNYSYLSLRYNENDVNKNDLNIICNIFKFLI